MPTDNSLVYGLPAPTLTDPWGLGGQRIRELRDKLEQELSFPHSSSESSAAQSIPNTVYTTLTWTAKSGDREGAMNLATGKYTAPRAGFYLISGMATFAVNTAGQRYLAVFVNNVQKTTTYVPATSLPAFVALSAGFSLAVGDVVDLRGYQNSGAALSTSGAPSQSNFTVAMLGR